MEDIFKRFKKNGNKNSLLNGQTSSTEGPGCTSWKDSKLKKKVDSKRYWDKKRMLRKLKWKQWRKQKKLRNQDVQSDKDSSILENTISIAIPGSILDNAQSNELKTYLAGRVIPYQSIPEEKEDKRKWNEKKMLKKLKKEQKKLPNQDVQSDKHSSILENSSKLNDYTISIAIPGSILDNAQSSELKTYLAGQIARAAAVFNVNEIIVFRETGREILDDGNVVLELDKKHRGCLQLLKILQYLECPQYLRKYFFPLQKELQYAGLLNPLDLPHHLREEDESKYREGIVLKNLYEDEEGSFVSIGLKKPAFIDESLQMGARVTVQLDEEQNSTKHLTGKAVSPSYPFKHDNMYWGYNVRLAKSLTSVFSDSPYKRGYDLTIGTSENGTNVDGVEFPKFKHLLVVFGGLKGLEASLEADKSISVNDPSKLFNYYLNTCPTQGSGTIQTEEAILITMAALRPKIQLQNAG